MALVTYPLNNLDYAAEDAELFHCTRSSGIYASDDFSCSVTGADNSITISAGIGWIRNSKFSGKVFALKAAETLDLGLADSSYPRIDAVVLQFDANKNATELVVKQGTASSSPTAPEISRTEALYELHLYHVCREVGATAVSISSVTDKRLDPDYCGLMADSVTQIDTAVINAQVLELIENLRQEIANVQDGSAFAPAKHDHTAEDVGAIPETGGDVSGWLNFTGTTVGLRWKTADGTEFRVRPYTSGNLFQITVVTVDGKEIPVFNIGNDGALSYSGGISNGNFTIKKADPHLYLNNENGGGDALGLHYYGSKSGANTFAIYDVTNGKHIFAIDQASNVASLYDAFINPHMTIGTEYKLAEYYNGSPVYAKWVDFGALPNNTYKSLSIGVAPAKMVSISGILYDTGNVSFVPFGAACDIATCFVNSANLLVVETTSDRTAWTGKFLLKYTK